MRLVTAFFLTAALTAACSSDPSASHEGSTSDPGAGGASGSAGSDAGTVTAGNGVGGKGTAGNGNAGSGGAGGSGYVCGPGNRLSLDDFCGAALYGPGPLCRPTLEASMAEAFGSGYSGKGSDVVQGCGLIGVELATPYGGRVIFYDENTHQLVGARGTTDCSCGPCGWSTWSAGSVPPDDCTLCTTCGVNPSLGMCDVNAGGAGGGGDQPASACSPGGAAGAGGSGGQGGY